MDFLLHRQKTHCHILPLPDGLQEIMGDISREVLRCQPSPDCIYKFIADYLDAMITAREKATIAMEIIEEAILKTDEVFDLFVKCRIPKEKTANFIDAMEITFRRFIEQKRKLKQDPRYITFQTDDMLDELIRKCDLTKVEILRSRPAIQWAYKKFVETYLKAIEGTLDTEALYQNTDKLLMSEMEYNDIIKSAVKIQSAYRGYSARKNVQIMKERKRQGLPTSASFLEFEKYTREHQDELTAAAVKIQASYKGFKVRQKVSVRSLRAADQPQAQSEMHDIDSFLAYAENNKKELENAAVKIQATYKGYKTRKQFKR